jgi:uracil-DNA glycosylase
MTFEMRSKAAKGIQLKAIEMDVINYQRDCFRNYKADIGYPQEYAYLFGNKVKVHVPIETTMSKCMVVGAYPSAKFYTVNSLADTPLEDHTSPFSNETYFDGSRLRTIPSGKELNELILARIGVKREDCWITNLVKVFLFKPGHVDRYKKLGKHDIEPNRNKYATYAKASLWWLHKEIEICSPYVIILLGREVTKAFFDVSLAKAITYMTGGAYSKVIDGVNRNIICLPHPGILMKKMTKNPWPERFENEIGPKAYNEIKNLVES